MHPRTTATLDELRDIQWFMNVGRNDTDAAKVLPDWASAIESCESSDWEDLCLEAANQYRERLLDKDLSYLDEWNGLVSSIRPTVTELVREKTVAVVKANALPKSFIDAVAWDILHLCMQAEYADVQSPGFYASQAFWYMKGHFPCGWHGPFPNGGRLVIF